MKAKLTVVAISFLIAGCTTTGNFRVPANSDLYIYDRPEPVDVGSDGSVTTRPFFWSAMGIPPSGGIPYRLEQDGEIVQEGTLRANFRVASIFWPPYAVIYWPVGFNPNVTYDLVEGMQE